MKSSEMKTDMNAEEEYGRIYLYDYPYSVLCCGTLQSAFAGVGLHMFVIWSVTEFKETSNITEFDRFKIWGVLAWFLVDFLMGIFLIVCTLCHWKGVFFRFWTILNMISNIFVNYYCFSCYKVFETLNIYAGFLVLYSFLRFLSSISVWHYSRLRDIPGPKVYLNLLNSSSNPENIFPRYSIQQEIGTKKSECSPFFVNKSYGVIKTKVFGKSFSKPVDISDL